MCRCAAVIATAAVAFLDAVLVGCLRSCFRPRLRRSEQDAPVRRDRDAEVNWDDERDLGRTGGRYDEEFTGGSMDKEELRLEANYLKLCDAISETPAELEIECDNTATNAPATNCASPLEANSSEGYEEHHTFATPLVLRDDMQTPGTIYTSHRGASLSGKRVQTRKQFIYPILRLIENRLEQMELKEDSSPLLLFNPPKRTKLEADSVKKPKQTHSNSVVKSGLSKASSSFTRQVKEALSPEKLLDSSELSKTNSDKKNAALSLSHWLKSSSTDVENQGDVKGAAADLSYGECSFPTERPVLNASDLETPSLPKAWDGNGIPNTTTRYKEDQRVSWHATPFEERLLKVLSDEEGRLPRKVVRGELFRLQEKAV